MLHACISHAACMSHAALSELHAACGLHVAFVLHSTSWRAVQNACSRSGSGLCICNSATYMLDSCCVLHVACMLHACRMFDACKCYRLRCMFHTIVYTSQAACCMLHAARCMLHTACGMLHAYSIRVVCCMPYCWPFELNVRACARTCESARVRVFVQHACGVNAT